MSSMGRMCASPFCTGHKPALRQTGPKQPCPLAVCNVRVSHAVRGHTCTVALPTVARGPGSGRKACSTDAGPPMPSWVFSSALLRQSGQSAATRRWATCLRCPSGTRTTWTWPRTAPSTSPTAPTSRRPSTGRSSTTTPCAPACSLCPRRALSHCGDCTLAAHTPHRPSDTPYTWAVFCAPAPSCAPSQDPSRCRRSAAAQLLASKALPRRPSCAGHGSWLQRHVRHWAASHTTSALSSTTAAASSLQQRQGMSVWGDRSSRC